jgi:hypothetical protein
MGVSYLEARRCDRQIVKRGLGARAQLADARQHRVGHRRRNARPWRREYLGDEERVPVGELEQGLGVDRRVGGKLGDCVSAERAERQARSPGQPAKQAPQWVTYTHLSVAVGEDQNRRKFRYAAGDVPEHVQRRAVSPVGILDDQDGRSWPPGQLLDRGRK